MIVRGEKGARKTTPEPERAPRFPTRLRQVETGQIDQTGAPGKGFRRPADERRGCTAEDEEPRRVVGPIDEHAEGLEQCRLA